MALISPLIRLIRITGGVTTEIGRSQGGKIVAWMEEDVPAAGTHTYKLQIKDNGAGASAGMVSASIVAQRAKR